MPEAHPKILYVCQQIVPYMPEEPMGVLCRGLVQAMQERGADVRIFMPRWGCINERRNQLHEVIRLSGMNLIIDDNDHQLIIKVASIPSARLQVYFIDNDDYFARKAVLEDIDGAFFADNDERALFFARGVLETIKKLRWAPDVVHCHGWFAALVPLYLRTMFADDPLFEKLRIVLSLHDDRFEAKLSGGFAAKALGEGIIADAKELAAPDYGSWMGLVMERADAIAIDTPAPDAALLAAARGSGKPLLEYALRATPQGWDTYKSFYDALLQESI